MRQEFYILEEVGKGWRVNKSIWTDLGFLGTWNTDLKGGFCLHTEAGTREGFLMIRGAGERIYWGGSCGGLRGGLASRTSLVVPYGTYMVFGLLLDCLAPDCISGPNRMDEVVLL
jgi:hypothetical protein